MTLLVERLRSYAQNNEMVDQYFTESGHGLIEAAAVIEDLEIANDALKLSLEMADMELRNRAATMPGYAKATMEQATAARQAWNENGSWLDIAQAVLAASPKVAPLAEDKGTPNDDAMMDYRADLSRERP